jgi:hypothetical protein
LEVTVTSSASSSYSSSNDPSSSSSSYDPSSSSSAAPSAAAAASFFCLLALVALLPRAHVVGALLLDGRDGHDHPVPLHARVALHGAEILAHVLHEAHEHVAPQVPELVLAPAELANHLHAVAALQKLLRRLEAHAVVVHVDVVPHLELLKLNLRRRRPLARLARLLLLLVLVLAVVHQTAHRGVRLGRHEHQVQPRLLGDVQRVVRGHDADHLLRRVVDHAHLGQVDVLVAQRAAVHRDAAAPAPAPTPAAAPAAAAAPAPARHRHDV